TSRNRPKTSSMSSGSFASGSGERLAAFASSSPEFGEANGCGKPPAGHAASHLEWVRSARDSDTNLATNC
ncbi:MAG: hypothetical protein ACXVBB_19470, partial [Isosphaeraceae bacterium]